MENIYITLRQIYSGRYVQNFIRIRGVFAEDMTKTFLCAFLALTSLMALKLLLQQP